MLCQFTATSLNSPGPQKTVINPVISVEQVTVAGDREGGVIKHRYWSIGQTAEQLAGFIIHRVKRPATRVSIRGRQNHAAE